MILLIDNFDSFTYNLYQYLGELGEEVIVIRNNQLSIQQIKDMNPKAIILSPGPGKPEEAGICIEVIQNLYQEIPILGICLGHQAIGAAFGSEIKRADFIKHGKTSQITHNGSGVFTYLTSPLEVMRYHSLVVAKESLSPELECVAQSLDDQEIMALKHRHYPVYGLQFHPESIGTPAGKQLLQNFLSEIEGKKRNEKLFTPIS
ncbi:aminodeoxychorismate/anthranilate synthase component II [Neobacillus sp. DY30]|uniref:anthranilate synthase component II n=1 Tax=Neobacillus sp. DY30 TaxID=3047871 RepID=UPI0024BF8413|nr:aminodeoxychorismate/anthranilate synthase component II [Neobacillus sp. DY30]WHX98906.1 aminodeoxychorismate/anthranilate synthase component II [Neobacillus sp. DY30]